ncbi:SRPBCC family protein [Streptomyces sp. NRRL B-24085]|uniref:SRPBCC family protein n=1 Tax=Streptomyces sp. NRRL B-24085 TaxID=1709476 RepID=UPI00277D14A1|nr:SRPBCC family protein [Streptomyces sp. NRRL B-24085]
MTVRRVELRALVRAERAEEVFAQVVRWDRYAELAPHVESAVVHTGFPATEGSSSWELHFRSGLLRWTEHERFEPGRGEVRFEQADGDFDSFSGSWEVRQDGPDVQVAFVCDFDFGIPSLEGILDPIAERVITETVAWTLTGMFPRTELATGLPLGAKDETTPGIPTSA